MLYDPTHQDRRQRVCRVNGSSMTNFTYTVLQLRNILSYKSPAYCRGNKELRAEMQVKPQ
jgi:hypothetical protein